MEGQIFLAGFTIQQLAETLAPAVASLLQPQVIQQLEPVNDLISRDEVCKLLRFNKVTLHKHTKTGRLKSYGIGNRVLYKRSEVLEAVEPLNK
jgi:excisionase family DNA binding protein